jgi:hypothetical protein
LTFFRYLDRAAGVYCQIVDVPFFGYDFGVESAFLLLFLKLIVLSRLVGLLDLLASKLIQSFGRLLLVSLSGVFLRHDLGLEGAVFELPFSLLPGRFLDPLRGVHGRLLIFPLSVLFSKFIRLT